MRTWCASRGTSDADDVEDLPSYRRKERCSAVEIPVRADVVFGKISARAGERRFSPYLVFLICTLCTAHVLLVRLAYRLDFSLASPTSSVP